MPFVRFRDRFGSATGWDEWAIPNADTDPILELAVVLPGLLVGLLLGACGDSAADERVLQLETQLAAAQATIGDLRTQEAD